MLTTGPQTLSRFAKALYLGAFYFNQGMPYGFLVLTLPVLLRQQGATATQIGALTFLALPWSLKVLWAPWIDRHGSEKFGRRRSWIVPLQLLLTLSLLALAQLQAPLWIAFAVLGINFIVATQDVAVDGLAIEILTPAERSWGNALQASAYKVGMIVGGGLIPGMLLGANALAGWQPTLMAIAALTLPALFLSLVLKEPHVPKPESGKEPSHGELVRSITAIPGIAWLLMFAFTAKLGDNFGTSMFRVLLVDRGWEADRIAQAVGTLGLVTSILGSALVVFPMRFLGHAKSFALAAVTQAVFLFAVALMANGNIDEPYWMALLAAEHFASGMVTTAVFTILMDHTPGHVAGSGFTALFTMTTLGMGAGSLLGGVSADHFGFVVTFGVAASMALLPVLVLPRIGRYHRSPKYPS